MNNYQTEFLEIDQNYSQYVISLSQPAYRLTYALELSLASTSLVRDYEISITDYTSEASAIHYNYATNQPIEIKEAINVYSTIIDGNLSNLDVTSAASTFVSAPFQPGATNLVVEPLMDIWMTSHLQSARVFRKKSCYSQSNLATSLLVTITLESMAKT